MDLPDGPFRGTEGLAAGLLTRAQLFGPRFRRVFPDVYVPAGDALDLVARSWAAYLLGRDRGGVLAGYSAATLLGADCAPTDAPAEVLVPTHSRAHPGLRVYRSWAIGDDVRQVPGSRVAALAETTAAARTTSSGRTPATGQVVAPVRVTAPIRTAWDLARRLPLVEAVVAVDCLARVGRFDPAEVLIHRAGARGVQALPGVVALADPRAESPGETRLRVLLRRAGLPTPEVQYRVLDEHGFVLGRVDLAYPAAKLAIEYDGASHLAALRVLRDRRRDRELADLGWETMRLGRDDLDTGPQTVQRVERALARRTRAAEGRSASPSATPVRHPDGRRRTVVAFAVFRPARAAWIRRLSGGLSSPAAAQDRWV